MSPEAVTPGKARDSRDRARASQVFRSDRVAAYIMLAPAAVSFIVFVAGPLFMGFGLTFMQWDGMSRGRFVGLDNYRTLLTDSLAATTLWNTVRFVVPDVLLKLMLGLVLAVVVDRFVMTPLRLLFRTVVFFPVIISAVAGATIWSWLMNTDLGLINYYLAQFFHLQIAWLDSADNAMWSLVLVDVWRNVGFYFVVFTAGLQGIGREYYEAAAIDGAGALAQFFKITIPLLSSSTYFLLIIALLDGFRFFDLPYVLTGGGPGDSTRTLVYYIYDSGFHFFRFGYASTLAMMLFLIIGAITWLQVKLSGRWVQYS